MMDARALWFTGPRQITLRAEEVAAPAATEALIETVASGISHGTEMLVYRGQVPPGTELDLPTLAGDFGYPIKYGYAAVGRVVATGSAIGDLQPGQMVFALHPHQSAFVAPRHLITPLPAGLEPLLGIFTANIETALNIVHDTPLRLGETAVVFGLGVVGVLVAQLLQRSGATVIGVDPLAHRRACAARCGIGLTLAPHADLTSEMHQMVGRPPDVAIEVSGAGAALQQAIDCVADEGTVVVASWYGSKMAELSLGGRFHRGRLTLRSSQVGRLNPASAPRWDYARRSELVASLLPTLELASLISHTFAFDTAPAAYQLIDTRPEEVVQVALRYT